MYTQHTFYNTQFMYKEVSSSVTCQHIDYEWNGDVSAAHDDVAISWRIQSVYGAIAVWTDSVLLILDCPPSKPLETIPARTSRGWPPSRWWVDSHRTALPLSPYRQEHSRWITTKCISITNDMFQSISITFVLSITLNK